MIKFLAMVSLVFGMSTSTYAANGADIAQLTTRVSNKAPVNNVTELSTEFNKIFFFTDIRDCSGCRIEHKWFYKGKLVSTVDGRAKSDRWRWWSSKTLTEDMVGLWTVKLFLDGQITRTKKFTYYKPTFTQRANTPVQKRLMAVEEDECEMQLRYFSEKSKEDPDDEYFQFMLQKWGKRCLGQ